MFIFEQLQARETRHLFKVIIRLNNLLSEFGSIRRKLARQESLGCQLAPVGCENIAAHDYCARNFSICYSVSTLMKRRNRNDSPKTTFKIINWAITPRPPQQPLETHRRFAHTAIMTARFTHIIGSQRNIRSGHFSPTAPQLPYLVCIMQQRQPFAWEVVTCSHQLKQLCHVLA